MTVVGLFGGAMFGAACGVQLSAQDKTLNAIDQAIASLNTNSSNWRFVLDRAIQQLPADAQSTIRNELTNLATRTIAAATEQFRCQVDFLGDRVRDGLLRIRAHVLGQSYPEPEPTLCDVTPSVVDMNLPPERRNQIAVSGYDFDSTPSLQLFLVGPRRTLDVSEQFTRQTHYHATVNLGANGVPISSEDSKLALRWNDHEVGLVPILQKSPSPCQSEPALTEPVARTYMPPYVPPGDRDFFGNVNITIKVELIPTPTHVDATIEMSAVQPSDDHTTAQGKSEAFRVYTAPAGKKITALLVPLTDQLSYHDSTWEDDTFEGAGGAVGKFAVRGDHNGDDAGTWTQVTVYFNAFNVQLTQTKDCQ